MFGRKKYKVKIKNVRALEGWPYPPRTGWGVKGSARGLAIGDVVLIKVTTKNRKTWTEVVVIRRADNRSRGLCHTPLV